MFRFVLNTAAVVLLVIAGMATAGSCKVVKVSSGHMISVHCDGKKQERVRLSAIDAPVRTKAFGNESRNNLAELCLGKTATLVHHGVNRLGHMIASVKCDGVDASARQIEDGFAVLDEQAADALVRDRLKALQENAQKYERGLWANTLPETQEALSDKGGNKDAAYLNTSTGQDCCKRRNPL
ncbi:MAG: thermonuclease family protein [Burkholderiales bacterium]|jgi:endonuclease YncB( thermonuclease family)|nr:thermonuclease family protein [Burkholderiales bacterium]